MLDRGFGILLVISLAFLTPDILLVQTVPVSFHQSIELSPKTLQSYPNSGILQSTLDVLCVKSLGVRPWPSPCSFSARLIVATEARVVHRIL